MHLKGTDPSYRAGATQFIALVSLANPDPADPLASELDYDGYSRVAQTKSSGWTEDTASQFSNAVQWQYGKRTDAGATQYARAFVVVDTASGAVSQAIIGLLDDTLDIGLNIKPIIEIGAAKIVASV
jgi:glucose-6-phosphate isomerase